MTSKNLFVQLVMVAISIAIIITFVKPTFAKIGSLQDDIVVYQTEQKKVSQVNTQLASLVTVLDNVSSDDRRRLLTYMPDEVDSIGVVRDLSLISDAAGVSYISALPTSETKAKINDSASAAQSDFIQPQEFGFSLSVEGTYEQIKYLFTLLEQNNYPIEVQTLSIKNKEGGFLSAEMNLLVYAHENSVAKEEIVF